jgi:uncharacterized membrane protein (DUF106 family)
MLEALNNGCLYIMDFVMGWTLNLPRDVVLLIVAVLTSLVLTGVRAFTTNQDFLKRCQNDKKRLGQLIKEAKRRGDKEAVKRHKDTIQLIGLKSFKQEGMPLLVSLLPIAMLATWAFDRLAFLAPPPGKPVAVTVEFPASAHGALVSLIPQEGMTCEGNSWIRQVSSATTSFDPRGRLPVVLKGDSPYKDSNDLVERAQWVLTCKQNPKSYPLLFRYHGETLDHELVMDGKTYFSPVGTWDENTINLQADLPEYKFLGFVPSIDLYWNKGVFIPLDAWLMGYLIIVIPLSFLFKPMLRIA